MKNYYEILEVNEKASNEVIEKAYRVLIKKYHPDVYNFREKQYTEEKIKEINQAYDVLSSPFLRQQYDNELKKERILEYQRHLEEDLKFEDKQRERMSKTENDKTNSRRKLSNKKEKKKSKIGSFGSIIDLTKQISSDLKKGNIKRKKLKDLDQKDILAIILTIIIVIAICIILWFIPFTRGFIEDITVNNPLISWIWKK